ncbi:4'-phosphopantetheinyl transferase superfamily protein [Niabella hibiscisoli]|nr:4'-phosphopantetheinyl transferase superfamily protein [Niabella hibiscisoli]
MLRVEHKFISPEEQLWLTPLTLEKATQVWSAKEAVYKWFGEGLVDFKQHIQLQGYKANDIFNCYFSKSQTSMEIHLKVLHPLCLSFIYCASV